MPNFALIRESVVVNIIVAELEWVTQYAKDHGYTAVDISTLGPVGPGYIQKGDVYFPPEEITTDHTSIPHDGVSSATITYKDNHPKPPKNVHATINGSPVTVALDDNGVGTLQVASQTPNDVIDVVIGGTTMSIEVDG